MARLLVARARIVTGHPSLLLTSRQTLGCALYAHSAPHPRFKGDEHFKTEPVPFATHEVGPAGLRDTKALGRLRLSQFVLLDVEAKIAHEICAHLEHGGFGRVKAKFHKDIAAGFGRFPFHDREELSGSGSVCSATRNVWREVQPIVTLSCAPLCRTAA